MLFLIDEDMPRAVADLLREESHQVREVTAEPGLRGKSDPVLAALGNEENAIIVTYNARDFRRITNRRSGGSEKLRWLGVVSFIKVPHPRAAERLGQVLDAIYFEYDRQQRCRDQRMFIEIYKSLFRVLR